MLDKMFTLFDQCAEAVAVQAEGEKESFLLAFLLVEVPFPRAFYWSDIAKLFLSQDQGHYYYDILGVDRLLYEQSELPSEAF